jgi:uncharacterized protein (TIGR03083 family)
MTDYGLMYAATRERVDALVRSLDDEQVARPVPACPGWSVHDVVAHFAGSVTDVLAGRMDGLGGDAWTAAQVDARRERPIADLLDEWAKGSPQFEDGLRAVGPAMAGLAISDAFQHEQDLRHALDAQGGRDLELALATIESYVPGLTIRVQGAGLGALHLGAGAHAFVAGDGEPTTSVTAEPFELARALGGRRTHDEMRALHWKGDADAYVPLLSSYGVPRSPLGER